MSSLAFRSPRCWFLTNNLAIQRSGFLVLLASVSPYQAEAAQGIEEVVTVVSSVLMEPTARVELDRSDIARGPAVSLGDLLVRTPAVKVQTNSRGEQVFSLRGSDQRQVAVTLDGAPLVSPWDGQLDLSLLPSSAIEQIVITRGPASVLQGPNALAGAVNVMSRRVTDPGWRRGVIASVGPERLGMEGFIGHNAGDHALSAAVAWTESDGYEPGGESALIPGSDFEALSAVLGWNYEYGNGTSTALTLLAVDNTKGVIAERDNPNPRYWRYSKLRKNMLIWYGHQPLPLGAVDYSLYLDHAKTRIDQFTDETYSTIEEIEDGRDRAGGGRVQWSHALSDAQELVLGAYWSKSKHWFRERGTAREYTPFSQVLSQLSAEWTHVQGPWTVLMGAAYERADNPDTGTLPDSGANDDWSATAGVNYVFNADLAFDFTVGRKTRFPSLRERYNGALGRFVLNPDLGPETALSAAAGLVGRHAGINWEVRAFGSEVSDGLARVTLEEGRFMRINQTRSRIMGIEFVLDGAITDRVHGRLAGTLLRARGKDAEGDYSERLEYRPGVNLGAELEVQLPEEWLLVAGVRHVGEEYGYITGNATIQKLPAYTVWDISAERTFRTGAGSEFSLMLRLDNVTDEYVQPQWGLPASGRRWSVNVAWKK